MTTHEEDLKKHVRVYLLIFAALAVLTLVTVGASKLDVSHTAHIVIALLIAGLKGTLVALFFMHLKGEKSLSILLTLLFTGIFLLVALLLPMLTDRNMLRSEQLEPQVPAAIEAPQEEAPGHH